MTTSLFRSEAVEHQRAKIWGAVTLAVPVPLTLLTLFVLACTLALGVFIATGSYARKEHARGYLAPQQHPVARMLDHDVQLVGAHVLGQAFAQVRYGVLVMRAERMTRLHGRCGQRAGDRGVGADR